MKLYIESVFDKDTNKMEDAKQKAIDTANNVEKSHGNLGAAKIYYFATAIDKLIISTGTIGMKAMGIKNQILDIKDIPDIKLGDIPTKFAKYQELVIPAVDFKAKKVVFTKLKDMNGEDNIGAEFKLTEIPNNNPVYDLKDYKVEIIDEQPKFLKIEPNQTIWGEVSFMVGSFGQVEPSDTIKILINGDIVELSLPIDNEQDNNYTSTNTAKVIKNNSQFYVDFEQVLFITHNLDNQHSKTGYSYSKIAKVTLRGYFYQPLNISILGQTNEDFTNEAFGYIQKSLNLIDLKPFKIPVPYTNVATKVDGLIQQHDFKIKKDKIYTDGITMGMITARKAGDFYPFSIHFNGTKPYTAFAFDHHKGQWACDLNGQYTYIDNKLLPVPEINKPFYAQMSLNYKTKIATFQIDKHKYSMDISPSKFNDFSFGGSATVFSSDMWYWIGDTADIKDNN